MIAGQTHSYLCDRSQVFPLPQSLGEDEAFWVNVYI